MKKDINRKKIFLEEDIRFNCLLRFYFDTVKMWSAKIFEVIR